MTGLWDDDKPAKRTLGIRDKQMILRKVTTQMRESYVWQRNRALQGLIQVHTFPLWLGRVWRILYHWEIPVDKNKYELSRPLELRVLVCRKSLPCSCLTSLTSKLSFNLTC